MIRLRNLFVLMVAATCLFAPLTFGQSIVQVIPLPNASYWNYAYGLAADSGHLYISSEWSTTSTYNYGFIYTLNHSAAPIDSVNPHYGYSQGLAFDGSNYYYIRRYTAKCTIVKVSQGGTVIDSINTPSGWYIGGACWDGSGLWISIYFPNNQNKLYKYNVSTKAVVDSIQCYGLQPQGIAWDGQYLYYVNDNNDGDAEKIYQVNVSTRDTVKSWYLPEGPTSNMSPRGLAWDGSYLWLIAEPVGASSGRSLYKYDLGGSGTPDIALVPPELDFGSRQLNIRHVDSIQIQNVGTAQLRIDSIRSILGSVWDTDLIPPVTIAPNSFVWMRIGFQPNHFGFYGLFIALYTNDPDEPVVILHVKGVGIYGSPTLSVIPEHDFATRRVGSSSSWLMTIQNQGATPFVISSITPGSPNFRIDSVGFPIAIDSLQSRSFRIWFRPTAAGPYVDTLKITSNASNGPVTNVVLSGIGNSAVAPLGTILWESAVPDNPFTSSNDYQPTSIKQIADMNGDGVNDVIVSSGNYFVTCFNGSSSVTGDVLWTFNSGYNNNNSGSVNWEDALQIRSDVNGDGIQDVVFGCGGGNEFVYTISGRTGGLIWAYGDSIDFSRGDIQAVRIDKDYNNDGVKDVLVSASGTGSGNGGRHAAICLNGLTGAEIFNVTQPQTFTQDIVATETGGAISANNNGAPYSINGFNNSGQPIWTYTAAGTAWNLREVSDIDNDGVKDIIGLQGFSGGIFAISGNSGGQLWASSLGSSNNGRIVLMDDLNHNGYIDFVLSGPQSLYRIDSKTGGIVWSIPLGSSYIRGVDRLTDVNGDSIPDIAIATQQPGKIMVLSGQNGSTLSEYVFGTTITERGDRAAVLSSIDGNLSTEFVGGNRQGRIVCFSGGLNTTVGIAPTTTLPTQFAVSQNYPNPFNPSTAINITLPVQSDFVLTIVDILGRRVRTLEYQRVPAGVHKIVWDGNDDKGLAVASGMYMYQVRAGSYLDTKKLVLLK